MGGGEDPLTYHTPPSLLSEALVAWSTGRVLNPAVQIFMGFVPVVLRALCTPGGWLSQVCAGLHSRSHRFDSQPSSPVGPFPSSTRSNARAPLCSVLSAAHPSDGVLGGRPHGCAARVRELREPRVLPRVEPLPGHPTDVHVSDHRPLPARKYVAEPSLGHGSEGAADFFALDKFSSAHGKFPPRPSPSVVMFAMSPMIRGLPGKNYPLPPA